MSVPGWIERLEPRTLLTGYLPSTVASFTTSTGSTPDGGLIVDPIGNLYGTTAAGGTAGNGTVFKIAAGTTAITTVASFTGTNGAKPMGTLYRDSAGTLWGTTNIGGANNSGSIFKILAGSSTITTVASFNTSGPSHPTGNLVADSAGDLFGATSQGGSGQGGIFELAYNSSSITIVATATNGNPQPDLSIDIAGNLYGATALGGPAGYGTVFEVVKNSNKITTLVAFTNGSFTPTPGYMPSGGLVVDSTGNIFGELYAQSNTVGLGSIFEIPHNSTSLTELAYFDSSTGNHPSGGLVADSAGNLFGTAGSSTSFFEYSHSKITLISNGFGTLGTLHGRLLIDSAGDVIGDTAQGGASNVGMVYNLTPSPSCSFTQYPTSATAGFNLSPVVKVALLDALGNVETSSSATVTISASFGTSLTGTTSVAAVNGVATFTGLAVTTAGTTTLTATSSGFVHGILPSFTVSPGAPAKLRFSSSIPNAVAGQLIGGISAITVQLVDAYGNLVSPNYSDSIALSLVGNTGLGSLIGTTTLSLNGSSINFSGLSATIAGTGYTLVASDSTNPAIASATSSIFSILPQAFQFSTVYNFDGTGGIYPNGPLLFDSAGNLYGTTGSGGSNNAGTAYTIPVSGPITPVYYNGIANGAFGGGTGPVGGLVADGAGNLYGAGFSSIYKIPAGSTTPVTIGVFVASAGYFYTPDGPLAIDSAGDVFGASYNGGDYHQGDIFEIPSGGTLTTLHSFNGSDGYEPEGGLVIDSSGNLFGTTVGGSKEGTIFEVPVGTSSPVTLVNGVAFLSGLTIDPTGNLFGTFLTGSSTYGIFELVKGSSTLTILATFDGNDGTTPASPPVVDEAGNLFGTTTAGGTGGEGTFYELPHGQSTPIAYYNFPRPGQTNSVYLSAGATLAFDSRGNLWGVTKRGGASTDDGTLFEISKNTTLTLSGTNYLQMDPDHVRVDVYNNSTGTGTPSLQVPVTNLSAIDVSYSTPAATLTIDCSTGIPIPPGGLNYAGIAKLTLIGTAGNDSVSTGQDSLTIDGISISGSAPVTFVPGGGSDALNVNTAFFTLDKPFLSAGTSEKFSSLVVGATGVVDASASLVSGQPDLIIIGALSVGGRFNLGANAMDISGSTLSAVDSLLQSGYDHGGCDANGIFSSTAVANSTHLTTLGVIQNDQSGQQLFGPANLFHGGTPAASDVLIGYTYYGDDNLDGKVDGSDYSRIDAGFISGGARTGWFNGDFNYDGVVDGSDYTLIDNAFNTQGARTAAVIASAAKVIGAINAHVVIASPNTDFMDLSAPINMERKKSRHLFLLSF